MTPLEALLELLDHVGASRDAAALVSEDDLSRWPAEAVRELKAKKLLQRASPAVSAVCPGCEQECVMPVHTPHTGAGQRLRLSATSGMTSTGQPPPFAAGRGDFQIESALIEEPDGLVAGFGVSDRSIGQGHTGGNSSSAEPDCP